MPLLCPHHQTQLTKTSKVAQKNWNTFMFQCVEAHRHQHFPKAFQCFGAAREIADWLVEQENPLTASRCTAVDIWALAGHNLIAQTDRAAETSAKQLFH